MPWLAQEQIPIPTKDILSWTFDEERYDLDRPIYIDTADPSQFITARQARVLIRQLVAGLRKAGLKAGDTVLIHSFNNIYYPVIALGIIATGCIFTGTNPSYTSHELKHHATASKAKFIISEPDILGNISSVAKILSLPLFILNANGSSGFPSWRTLLNYDEEDWVRFDSQQKSQTTTAMLLFSSGTTGLPKPAILSHYNLIAQHTLAFEHQPPPYLRKRLVPLPLFHAATAPSTITGALRSGHPNYIMARFEPTLYLQNVQRFSITDLVLVPPMVVSLVNLPPPATAKSKAEQLKSVRFAAAGAAPLDKEMQARLQALLPHDAPFTQVWAMTETSCFASAFPWPENDDTGSVGRFLPGLDVKLVDDDGKEIEAYDKPGELCIRGPTVIRGYLDNPQANARDFDTDGYFHTGDILYCDGETKLWYIIDRKKELIKVRGFQVAPAEIEGVLLEYEAVLDVAVIGVKVGRDEEVPRAYVVLKPGMEGVSEQSIKSFTGTRLAGYKRLDGGVKFVASIPKTASGKILKRLLREQAAKDGASKL